MPLDLAGTQQTTSAPTPTGVNSMPLDKTITTQPVGTITPLEPPTPLEPRIIGTVVNGVRDSSYVIDWFKDPNRQADSHGRPTSYIDQTTGQKVIIQQGAYTAQVGATPIDRGTYSSPTGTPISRETAMSSGAIDSPKVASDIFASQVSAANAREAVAYTPAPTLKQVIGIDAMKASELASANARTELAQRLAGTTPQEAAAIAKMLQSPTATFGSQETMQRGFDIVNAKGLNVNPIDIKAHVDISTQAQKDAQRNLGMDVILPSGNVNPNLSQTQIKSLVDVGALQYKTESTLSPHGRSLNAFVDFKMPTDINPLTGKGYATQDVAFQKKEGYDLVNPSGQIILTSQENKDYQKAYDEAGKGVTSAKFQLDEAARQRYALVSAMGKDKYERAQDIINSRESERLSSLGGELSQTERLKYAYSSPETTVSALAGVFTNLSPRSTEAERLTSIKEFNVALGRKSEEYKDLSTKEAIVKYGLESPLTAMIPVGAGFKAGTFALETGLKSGIAKTLTGGLASKLVTKELELGVGKHVVKGSAVQLGMSAIFGAPIVADIASSKSVAEGFGKVGTLGMSLPGFGLGHGGATKVGENIGEVKPRFKPFVTEKVVTPISETKLGQSIIERTPDFVRTTTKPLIERATRVREQPIPSISKIDVNDLFTTKSEEVYKKLEGKSRAVTAEDVGKGTYGHKTTQAPEGSTINRQLKLESGLKILKYAESIPLKTRTIEKVDLSQTKYAGKIGKSVQEMILEKPEDYILGGSTAIPGVKGKDIDLYAKNHARTVSKIEKMVAKEYPGYTKETNKMGMVTFKQSSGESIIDIHEFSDLKVGEVYNLRGGQTTGKVLKPIQDPSGMYRISPRELLGRKMEGVSNLLEFEATGRGSGKTRAKDVEHQERLIEQLRTDVEKKVSKSELEKFDEEVKKFKFNVRSPEAAALEYGYEVGKEFVGKYKTIPPISFSIKSPKTEYYDVTGGKKTQITTGYPTTSKAVKNMVGSYYPTTPTKKVEIGIYPTPIRPSPIDGGYYPPIKPISPIDGGYYQLPTKPVEPPGGYYTTPPKGDGEYYGGFNPNQPLRPYQDRFWSETLQTEIPSDYYFDKNGEKVETKRKSKRKEMILYEAKTRLSPIFGGSERLFEGIKSPIQTSKKASIKKSQPRPTNMPTFDMGNLGFLNNPIKTNKPKYKKTNKNVNKKPSWL